MNTLVPAELREEMALRHERLRPYIKGALLVGSNANIYYTSGRFFRGYVWLPAEGPAIWFVIRPNVFAEADDVATIRKPEQIPDILGERGIAVPDEVGLELDVLSYNDIMRLEKVFAQSSIYDSSQILRNARMVKTPYELEEMRKDGLHQAAVYHRIPRLYKPDMTDLEFQIEIERVLRLEGCLGYVRTAGNLMEINMGSVINGDNADNPTPYDFSMGGSGADASLPVGANGAIMHTGTTVMVDMNGSFNGYQTDMTRVWSIGEISPLAQKAHACACRILRKCEEIALPGAEVCSLYHAAMAIVEEEGLADYFMGHRQKVGFIGHGVGIELNEQPPITARNRTLLREDMALAIEPKFVIPGVGAVGPENTYVVTAEGLKNLTVFPEEIANLL